jgi:outer membrane biosynthesis protein TonB
MKCKLRISYLAGALALAGAMMTPAMADEFNKETRMETNVPLEIPGHVLVPGTYIFKLADSPSDRNIIEVYSEDSNGNQTFVTTFFAISAYRLQTPDKPIFNFEERPAGTPEAIKTWFYPGDNYGWEFVYPKTNNVETAQNQAPAAQPAPAPVEPPQPPAEPVAAPAPEPTPVEEPVVTEAILVEKETVVILSEDTPEASGADDTELPTTAGYSAAELLAGMIMLSLGGLILIPALRRNAA